MPTPSNADSQEVTPRPSSADGAYRETFLSNLCPDLRLDSMFPTIRLTFGIRQESSTSEVVPEDGQYFDHRFQDGLLSISDPSQRQCLFYS